MRNDREYLRDVFTGRIPPQKIVREIDSRDWEKTTRVKLEYRTGSLPPEYYRNVSISISYWRIDIEISSYNAVLTKYNKSVQEDDFQSLLLKLSHQHICKVEIDRTKPREVGGRLGLLSLYSDENGRYFSAYFTGWKSYGDLSFEGCLLESIYTTFPWLEEKIEEMIESVDYQRQLMKLLRL